MSKSLRVSDELFHAAQEMGSILSRSAADQVEHWARLGLSLEQKGLTIDAALELLGKKTLTHQSVILATEDLMQRKRSLQRANVAAVKSGQATSEDMAWLGSKIAQNSKVLSAVI